jgi:serine phosphatase RsbU (regulator of sigma subunit)
MKSKHCIILLLTSFSFFIHAENQQTDSLKSVLDTASGKNRIKTLNNISFLCRFSDGDFAMKSGLEGLILSKEASFPEVEVYLHLNVGLLYFDKGQYEKALNQFIAAENVAENLSDKKALAAVMQNIGIVYQTQAFYDKALVNYISALNNFKEINDRSSTASVYTSMGSLYYELKDNEKALDYFMKSLAIMEELNDKKGIADGLNNTAMIYEEMKNYSKAMEYHRKSLRLSREQSNLRSVSTSLYNIALIYNSLHDNDNAIKYIDSASAIATTEGYFEFLKEYYSTLSEIFYKKNDFKTALHYYTLLSVLKDTLVNQDRNKQIVEMSTKYQTEKKEKENQILKQQNDLQDMSINRQKVINYSVTVGLILVLILAFYIFRGYRQKQKANALLEKKQVEIIVKNEELEFANRVIKDKNKDITDSIRYAKRLQTAILKPENTLGSYFDDGFIFFRPKDIVSGDFYWFEKFGNLTLVAAADCTGHGVPGAFMSIIGCNLLSQTVNEHAITRPAAILNSVNKGLSKVLQQRNEEVSVKDGMDIALCVFNSDKMFLEYSGAFNPMWLVRNGVLMEFKGDKFPVGAFVDNEVRIFKNHEMPVEKGDQVYLFSDGFADQFGGPAGKKIKYKTLQKLIIENYAKPSSVQKEIFEQAFIEWMGDLEQVDDVLLMSVKI